MEHFLVITNYSKDRNGEVSSKVVNYIRSKGKNCKFLFCRDRENKQPNLFKNISDIPPQTECIVVLGGDGTMLEVARRTVTTRIPLVGINLGTLGYLTEINIDNIEPALDALIDNNYSVGNRMMLLGNVYHKNKLIVSDIAVNDIAISKPDTESLISLDIKVNEARLNSYKADGVIVSTATGSTGYSLSAGGPIISPDARLLMITPVSPHTMINRSVILRPFDRIKIERGYNSDGFPGYAMVMFDGVKKARITSGDFVEVVKAEMDVPIIKVFKSSFLDVLAHKMIQ